MAYKRKGLLTVSKEWAKHLKKGGKRDFWKRERKTIKREIKKDDSSLLGY